MKKIAILAGVALISLLAPARAEVASVSCVAGGTSDIIQVDSMAFPPGISVLSKTNSLIGSFTVEVSNSQPLKPSGGMNYVISKSDAGGITGWIGHENLSEQIGDALDNVAFPIAFIRLNCGNVTGGTVTLSIATRAHSG